jgi:hypothetical protein
MDSEQSQLQLFVNYIINSNLDDELQNLDFRFCKVIQWTLHERNNYAKTKGFISKLSVMTQINLFSQSWNTLWKILPGIVNTCIRFRGCSRYKITTDSKSYFPEVKGNFEPKSLLMKW